MSRRPGVVCALLQGCYQGLGIVELGILVGRSVGSKCCDLCSRRSAARPDEGLSANEVRHAAHVHSLNLFPFAG